MSQDDFPLHFPNRRPPRFQLVDSLRGDGDDRDNRPLVPEAWSWRDPSKIPPRRWLLGSSLMRGYTTLLGSPGGVGKTALAIAYALAVITGRRKITGQNVFETGSVWFITLEDDRLELERRIAAAMLLHEIEPDAIDGKLFINDTTERPLVLIQAEADGGYSVHPDRDLICAGIRLRGVALCVLDPVIKAHRASENSNEHMDGLVSTTNSIAHETKSALLLPCHFRKAATNGADRSERDAFRGASSFIDGCRIAEALLQMNVQQADRSQIPPDDAFRYVQILNAKANLATKQNSRWFKLESIPLGNTNVNLLYPNGDHVQAALPWSPPSPFAGFPWDTLLRIFDAIEQPSDGEFFSAAPNAKRWLGHLIINETGKSREQAKNIIDLWLKEGVLLHDTYSSSSRKDTVPCLRLNQSKVLEMRQQQNAHSPIVPD